MNDNYSSVSSDFHSLDNESISSVVNLNSFKLLSLNVCGLKNKLEYPEFKTMLNMYDIVCLTETKFDNLDVVDDD